MTTGQKGAGGLSVNKSSAASVCEHEDAKILVATIFLCFLLVNLSFWNVSSNTLKKSYGPRERPSMQTADLKPVTFDVTSSGKFNHQRDNFQVLEESPPWREISSAFLGSHMGIRAKASRLWIVYLSPVLCLSSSHTISKFYNMRHTFLLFAICEKVHCFYIVYVLCFKYLKLHFLIN